MAVMKHSRLFKQIYCRHMSTLG